MAQLPADTRSARQAREFVTSALDSWSVPEELVQDIVLAASELVSNAVEHGCGEVAMELGLGNDRITLRVRDESLDAPQRQPSDVRSVRGRGLAIVEALSVDWGYLPAEDGKWVWAEFALPDSVLSETVLPENAPPDNGGPPATDHPGGAG
ncbi:MAG TPA: ATP-binding protein [Pseudonocardiaceae bacterium]|nr:ATP-binding protein [Pseudonocardiaceae bacterium]